MIPDRATLAFRADHLAGLLVTEWVPVCLGAAVIVWLLAARTRSAVARERVLVLLSLVLVVWFASPIVAGAWLAYALVFYVLVEHGPRGVVGVSAMTALLAAMVFGPVLAIAPLGEQGRHTREFVAFATSMALFRFYAYVWDRWRDRIERVPVRRFLLAMFFFPTFINGPLESPRMLADGWDPPESRQLGAAVRAGLWRIIVGGLKIVIAALAFRPGWTEVLADGLTVPWWQLWTWGFLLYAWFYLSFSGWSDLAIGVGRLCGRRVHENFDAPWAALEPADFWRRWHLSLGVWLRDFVYIPLGGNRRHRRVNVLVTFLVSAVWHIWGAVKLLGLGFFGPHVWGGFILWGLFNAAGVMAAVAVRRAIGGSGLAGRVAARCGMLLFAAFCWIPFFLPPNVRFGSALQILVRMIWPF